MSNAEAEGDEGQAEGGASIALEPLADDAQAEGGPEDEPLEFDLEAVGDELAAAEAFVEERVQAALAPVRGMFPEAVLEEYAEGLRCFLLTHPVASRMLARVRPRALRSTSGEGVIMGAALGDAVETTKDGVG